MNSFQTVAILFIFGNLVGCQSVPSQSIPVTNEEKDKYITKVEEVVSDSASALVAVVASLPEGDIRQLTEAQVTRLSGLSKPSVAKVEYYTGVLKKGDSKAIQKDKEEASKVDQQTNELWSMVEEREAELDATKVALAQAEKERQLAFKERVLWMFSCVGIALVTLGIILFAVTPIKRGGIFISIGGLVLMSSLWIYDSIWFNYIACTAVTIGLIDLLFILVKFTLNFIKHKDSVDVASGQDKEQKQDV
jgi:hypothetical protein